ncbi:MAG: hypothetical protein ACTHMU_26240 [Thermomicrobiales bacterium]
MRSYRIVTGDKAARRAAGYRFQVELQVSQANACAGLQEPVNLEPATPQPAITAEAIGMDGLMQDYPLTVQHILWRIERLFGRK